MRVRLSNAAVRSGSEGAEDSRSSRAARDGPRRVTNPFPPRTGVETPARHAGGLESEQPLAGRDTGAAHADGRTARAGGRAFPPEGGQLLPAAEAAARTGGLGGGEG